MAHDFGNGLSFRSRTLLGGYAKFYQNVYSTRFTAATGLVTLGAYNNRNDRTNLFSQNDLVWNNRLAGIDQTLLAGFEVGRAEITQFPRDRGRSRTATRRRSATPRSTPT